MDLLRQLSIQVRLSNIPGVSSLHQNHAGLRQNQNPPSRNVDPDGPNEPYCWVIYQTLLQPQEGIRTQQPFHGHLVSPEGTGKRTQNGQVPMTLEVSGCKTTHTVNGFVGYLDPLCKGMISVADFGSYRRGEGLRDSQVSEASATGQSSQLT